MASSIATHVAEMASVNLFARDGDGRWKSGMFVGRPYFISYERMYVLVADAWKQQAKGLPQGSFLLAYY
jgi:hypothetical protein